MMFITKAYAAVDAGMDAGVDPMEGVPSAMDAALMNVMPIIVLAVAFYFLLIVPQQRRFKEHNKMLSELKKGDRVVTGGGLVGKVHDLVDDKEVVIDLGNGVKVTAVRSMIQNKTELKPENVANDSKGAEEKPKAKAKKDTKSSKSTKKA